MSEARASKRSIDASLESLRSDIEQIGYLESGYELSVEQIHFITDTHIRGRTWMILWPPQQILRCYAARVCAVRRHDVP